MWVKARGSKGFEFARRMREKVRGEYRFSSLMKQKKKRKITLSFTSPDFFFKKKFCYEVIVKQN